MPALWSPKDLAVRFAPYIEELHDVFVMHGVHYGSPEDICQLTARLQKPGPLNEELAALVRSMVLREGGSIPRTDLLEIVAIAIAGPRMDPAGEELQPSVRQLLSFLHAALRRPWNEPPGEERLHPDEDPRAEAARELREAAAKIEAEVQGAGRERQSEVEVTGEAAAHAFRANVIPFGRARAVFSRLARAEATEPMDDDETELQEPAAGIAAASIPENPIAQPPIPSSEIADANPVHLPAMQAAHPVAPDQLAEREASIPPTTLAQAQASAPSTVPSEIITSSAIADVVPLVLPALLTETVAAASLPTSDAAQQQAQLASPLAQAAETLPTAPPLPPQMDSVVEARGAVPDAMREAATISAPSPKKLLPPVPNVMRQATTTPVALPEFDEEPPLPAAPHVNRTVFVYGIAAVVLLAAGLGFALRTKTPAHVAAYPPSVASSDSPKAIKPTAAQPAVLLAGAVPNDGSSKPSPGTDVSGSQPVHVSHFDDDYIAPPYSNMPAERDSAAVSVPSAATESSSSLAPKVEDVSAKQGSEPHFELTRPRNPDASIVGDATVRTSAIALAEPPPHPHIAAGLMAENLVSAPRPDYPALAKFAHVDGPVILHAEINRSGEVSDTQVISGHFLLRRAAEAAVKHWRYRPYQVDGKSVPVSTTITVRFRH
jgi:TonB family protein